MEGIKYIQRNRLVVDTVSQDENSALVAEHSNSIVTENSIWFDPPHPDFSDLNIAVDNWNSASNAQRTEQMWNLIKDYDCANKYYTKYGYSCGVISYLTSGVFCRSGNRFTKFSLRRGNDSPWVFPYVGDEQFWYLQNANLELNFSLNNMQVGVCNNLDSANSINYSDVTGNIYENYLSGQDWGKLSFYNYARILALGQPYIACPSDQWSPSLEASCRMYNFTPNFTGNKGVLPVGLVMLRDIILKTTNENLNNFGIYGFVIVMPFFIEPSQVVRGFSIGKEIFVVGNGLKAEVFLGVITSERDLAKCCISNQNLRGMDSGGLSNLFLGKDGKLRFSSSIQSTSGYYEDIDCKNVCHEIVDFSVPGACNGVFYFKSPITYDMGVKYLVFGMRPYDINGNGREYPPSTNLYGTDTSFLGNYALIDISAKKFYLI